MLTPEQLNQKTQSSVDKIVEAENSIWTMIINALFKANKRNEAAEAIKWQRELLSYSSDIIKQAQDILKEPMNEVKAKNADQLSKIVNEDMAEVEEFLKGGADAGLLDQAAPISDDDAINMMVVAAQRDSSNYLDMASKNMTKHALDVFKSIIADATLSARNGAPIDKALGDATNRWADYGIPALIDKQGKRWSPEAYTRMCLNSSINNLTNDAELARTGEYGAYVIVSSHNASRPSHVQFQGQIYSLSTKDKRYPYFYTTTSYGTPSGIGGINCRHYPMSYIPGYGSLPAPVDKADNAKDYTATQKQRYYERSIRAAKRRITASEKLGDELAKKRAKKLLRSRQARMRRFISNSGLTRQYNRER